MGGAYLRTSAWHGNFHAIVNKNLVSGIILSGDLAHASGLELATLPPMYPSFAMWEENRQVASISDWRHLQRSSPSSSSHYSAAPVVAGSKEDKNFLRLHFLFFLRKFYVCEIPPSPPPFFCSRWYEAKCGFFLVTLSISPQKKKSHRTADFFGREAPGHPKKLCFFFPLLSPQKTLFFSDVTQPLRQIKATLRKQFLSKDWNLT